MAVNFLRQQFPLRPYLVTEADGTDVPSVFSHQASAILSLQERFAPRHGNTDMVTSKAFLVCNLNNATLA
jgi:hypothetical protein